MGRVLGRGIGYLAQIMFARVLAPESFGLFAIGWTLLRLFSIAGHFGMDSGVIKFGGQYWQKNALKLRSVVLVSLTSAFLSGAIMGMLLYISAPWLAEVFFRKPALVPIFRGFAIIFPFATILRVAAATSSLSGKMLCGAISEDIAQPILQIGLFLVLFNMGMGLNAAILSIGVSYGISVIIGLVCVARSIPGIIGLGRILSDDLVPILRFSFPAIVGVTLGAFNLWGDRLLVGYFSTEASTGIYQSVSVLTMFTTIILSGFKISIAPAIAHLYYRGEHEAVKTLVRSVIRWALYISLPILIFVFVNANGLIIGLFGLKYQSGTVPLLILTIGQVFYVAFGIADQIFLMSGRQKEWVKISASIFALTIVLDAILIPRTNLIGASVVSSVMMLLLGAVATMRLKHHLKFWLFDNYHAKIIVASVITTLITHPIATNLPFGFAANALVTILIICALFMTIVWAYGMETGDRAIIHQIIRKKTPRQ